MESRSILPTVGFLLAGIALVAGFLPWVGDPTTLAGVQFGSPVGVGLAAVASMAFFARRHGLLEVARAAPLAVVSSAAVVFLAFLRLLVPAIGTQTPPGTGPGLIVAAVASIAAAITAYTDWVGVPIDGLRNRLSLTMQGAVLGLGGLIFGSVGSVLLLLPLQSSPQPVRYGAQLVGFGIGVAVLIGVYLVATDRTLSYLDVEVPTLRGLGYVVGGIVVLFTLLFGIEYASQALELPRAGSNIESQIRNFGDPVVILPFIPLSLLIIGPAEELVYRNLIQKPLYDAFSRRGAVLTASVIFALMHIPQYSPPGASAIETLNALVLVFVLSLVLAIAYERTDNIVVPILIHGSFNAIQFLLLYVTLVSGGMPS